jgi:uncharacterized membrane protein
MILLALIAILAGSYGVLVVVAPQMDDKQRGRISLALLFLFTGLGHFVNPEPMAAMLPPWVPSRVPLIYATGLLEWAGAIGLLVPRYARMAGLCLMTFLIAVFPANVFAALHHVGMGGHDAGPAYLLVRGPFQVALMWWTYRAAVRAPSVEQEPAGV